MVILAGRYKGKSIKTDPRAVYRPTQSRIRKSLFDMLGDLDGATVLDLYAGSGILGFEAVSRGADHVTFVDHHYRVIQLLKTNAELFDGLSCRIVKMDAIRFLESCGRYDLIIADPPYGTISAIAKTGKISLIEMCLARLKLGGRFVLETSSGEKCISGDREKIYGDTKLIIWSKTT